MTEYLSGPHFWFALATWSAIVAIGQQIRQPGHNYMINALVAAVAVFMGVLS